MTMTQLQQCAHFHICNTSFPQGRPTNLHLKWSQKQDLELRSWQYLHDSDSALGVFISRNGTSCAIAKLSLLVCILIFTTLPDLLTSVMAFMQSTLPFRQLSPSDLHIRIVPYSPALAWNNRDSILHICRGKDHTVISIVYVLTG